MGKLSINDKTSRFVAFNGNPSTAAKSEMGANFVGGGWATYFRRRLYCSPSVTSFVTFTKAPLANRTCQFCSLLPHKIAKIKGLNHESGSFMQLCPSRTFSTSSSSWKIWPLAWYLGKLESQPFITKSLTTSLIYAAADCTSQMIASDSAYDLIRTSRMAGFGLLLLGPSQHLWFNFVSKILPRRDLLTTLKKILMGQAFYGPATTSVFFSYNAALQGESGTEILARLKRDLLPTLINGAMYWPLCDFVTFKFIPVHLQPLMNSSCAYIWTIYLTYKASLKRVAVE